MDKIDLIIDALELARNEIHDPTLWTDKVDQAIAAARELKDECRTGMESYATTDGFDMTWNN